MSKEHVTTTITPEQKNLARRENIGISEALAFGIEFLIADKYDCLYPNNNLTSKIEKLAIRLEEFSRKCELLENENAELKRKMANMKEKVGLNRYEASV